MTGIILAAGSGRRLRIHKPKGMLNIGGRPLIDYSIKSLKRVGVNEIYIVTGFKSEVYEHHFLFDENIHLIYNPEYANCGSLYSLHLALQRVDDDVVILDSDILYNYDEFAEFMRADYPDSILATNVSEGRHDACYCQTDLSDNLVKISKNIHYISLREDETPWEYIGITKCSRAALPLIREYSGSKFSDGNLDHEYDYVFESIRKQFKVLRYPDYVWSEADDNVQLEYMTSIVYPKITIPE